MVLRIVLALLIAPAVAAALAAQQPSSSSDKPAADRKPDEAVVTGCLAGTVLTSTDTGERDASASVAMGERYRLTGPKDIIKQLKKLNGQVVEVTGTIKASSTPGGYQRRVGKTTIVVGGATTHDPSRPTNPIDDPTVPPELKVTSFKDLDYRCAEK